MKMQNSSDYPSGKGRDHSTSRKKHLHFWPRRHDEQEPRKSVSEIGSPGESSISLNNFRDAFRKCYLLCPCQTLSIGTWHVSAVSTRVSKCCRLHLSATLCRAGLREASASASSWHSARNDRSFSSYDNFPT